MWTPPPPAARAHTERRRRQWSGAPRGALVSAGTAVPRDALEGGEVPPPALQGAQPVSLTPTASLNGICNRQ